MPQVVTEILWTAKLNDSLPGFTIKTEKARLHLLRKFQAESVELRRNGCAVFEFKNLKVKHSLFFMFTGMGKLELTADSFIIETLPEDFDFLSKALGGSLGKEIIFKNILVEAVLIGDKIILNRAAGREKNFEVKANGYYVKKRKMDFAVEILLSRQFIAAMKEDARKFLIEDPENGGGKIKLRIFGFPDKPSFEMKTGFLEVNIS